jgi:hypothetical protein
MSSSPVTSTAADREGLVGTTDVPAGIVRFVGLLFVILAILLAYLLAAFWPTKPPKADDWNRGVTLFGYWNFELDTEVRLIWLVIIAASIGSCVHSVTSFASYVGNRTLARSWLWWYALRTPIGAALAIVFYCVIRAGLFSTGSLGADINPFGVAALSGLVGMFSKQATDKLREVFDNLFRTAPGKGDDTREDKLTAAKPVINTIDPTSVDKGGNNVPVRILGSGFVEGAVAAVNGVPRRTEFRSETEIVGFLIEGDLAAAAALDITVRSPPPSDKLSNAVRLVVRDPATTTG